MTGGTVTEGADTGFGAKFYVSIPQSALRLPALHKGAKGGTQPEPLGKIVTFPPHPPNKVRHLLGRKNRRAGQNGRRAGWF